MGPAFHPQQHKGEVSMMSKARREAERLFNSLSPTSELGAQVLYSTRGKPLITVLVPVHKCTLGQGYHELMALRDCRFSPAIVQSEFGPCIRLFRDASYLQAHETGKFLAVVRKAVRHTEEVFETRAEAVSGGGRFELLFRYGA
jgi:hypothetical protein